jgi:prepilin-type N-terminal cleavage/methylation domain-containing protein
MRFACHSRHRTAGFTLAEVLVTIAVTALFAVATYATNERLVFTLKSQKETTAVTTALQWRMEMLRGTSFSCITGNPGNCTPLSGTAADYVKNYILTIRTATDSNGNTVDPFAPLGSITEQFTIGAYPTDGTTKTVLSWTASAGATYVSQNTNLWGGTYSNGSTTNGSTTLADTTDVPFTSSMVGGQVTGSGIPSNTVISSFTDSGHVVLSQAATATASPVSVTVTRPLVKVDVLETWTGANGRQRQRQLSTIVGIGNKGE